MYILLVGPTICVICQAFQVKVLWIFVQQKGTFMYKHIVNVFFNIPIKVS
jgi:hypothetical protein